MKLKLHYSIFLFLPCFGFAQSASFKVLPFVDATTTIKDGLIEVGPELNWQNNSNGKTFSLRPTFRMPLTNKTDNILQIDRFSSTWKGVVALQYTQDNTQASGLISRSSFSGQFEYGFADFKYYPTGNKNNEVKTGESSYALELKYIKFYTPGVSGARQYSPQFRLRYSYDWKQANEVGVVNLPNTNGVITTTNMIIEKPNVKPTFSPAFSFQYYKGKGMFSYAPTIYYDFIGKSGTKNIFNNLQRLRAEYWIFFYPLIANSPNVKIGLSPFLSIRTKGSDTFNKAEYGGMVTIKFGTTFLQFL